MLQLPDRSQRAMESSPDPRLRALAQIQAVEARQRADVVSFREGALAGRLLSQEEVPAWLLERWQKDGAPTAFLGLQLPPGVKLSMGEWWDSVRSLTLPPREPLGLLFVREDGVLGRLKRIAEGLVEAFAWGEGQAVGFVLTDTVPTISKNKVTTHYLALGGKPIRVVMELDPQTRVAEVATLFQEACRETLFGQVRRFRRYKPISLRHGELAVFLAKTPGLSWQKRREAWNEQAPKESWRYYARFRFRSEAVAAYKRVTGKTWRQRGDS
ncbi:MAG: hypothetical protein ABID40_02985 [Candidatus Bipolaricaulota bacterium]